MTLEFTILNSCLPFWLSWRTKAKPSIKIAGSGKYAQLIEYGIETAEMAKYNENKIEIEVIE